MNIDFKFYWSLLLRRFPVMALLLLLCSGLGFLTAMQLPETYSASARLLVEEPQIPDAMVRSTVQTDVIEQLDIIQQRLLTRANLIDIANRFDVFPDMRNMEPDEVLSLMRSATRIRRTAGRNQATLLTIRFEARTGQIAANVVNEYMTLVLESNIEFRMSRAENTLDFFEQEVARIGVELDEKSAEITAFKSANADALPEDQSYRLGRQSLLQERLSNLERDVRASERQRDDLTRLFETTGRIGQTRRNQRSAEEQRLIVARADLEHALSTFSEENPRIIRYRSIVERLEAVVAAQTAANNQFDYDDEEALSPEEALFRATMIEIDNRVGTIEDEIARARNELESVQLAITASSANGIQLSALQRDYNNIQSRYNNALNNLNGAQMSERIETTAQGQRISVIEGAVVPRTPSGPNRTKIMIAGGAAGMGLAGGYFFLLELLNRSIRRPAEMMSRFQITPITSIPYMESRGRKFLRRATLVIATLIVIIGVPLGLWYVDTYYLPLDLVMQKILIRIGL